MNILEAIILGLVEGVTEFLPISSTAHLIITRQLLGIPESPFLDFFTIAIQSGAILAVVVLFWRTLLQSRDTMLKIVAAFIPTAIVGLVMKKTIVDVFFESNALIGWSLVVVGVLFILVELFVAQKHIKLPKTVALMTYQDAMLIGLVQSFAVVPGVSRAGAVIIIMMLLRYTRSQAALFSFLLAIPTILGASVVGGFDIDMRTLQGADIVALSTGTLVAFVSALLCMKWLIGFLQKKELYLFAIYRIVIGIIILLLVMYGRG